MIRILKKYRGIIFFILFVTVCYLAVVWIQGQPSSNLAYTQEYVSGTENIKGEVDVEKWNSLGKDFEIGANADGYAVFKNPSAAMNAICRDYKKGIRAMQEEGAPYGFRRHYNAYIDYAFSVAGDAETIRQAHIVAGFVDIYENSFDSAG